MASLRDFFPIFLSIATVIVVADSHLNSDTFINFLNSQQTTWKARKNYLTKAPIKQLKKLMGVIQDDLLYTLPERTHSDDVIKNLPDNFDPRDKWPKCPTLNEIRDQGACGSCWAFGAVEAMTDRYCIFSNGTKHFHFSSQDLLSCCEACGLGCDGGKTRTAWEYWMDMGIVSGGNYNSSQGCYPYEIPPCDHLNVENQIPCNEDNDTPLCKTKCNHNYNLHFEEDVKFSNYIFYVRDEDHIKAELFLYGPVEGTLTVYTDLIAYESGVYKHKAGEELGKHAVKIIGYGVESEIKYWLAANSWSTEWGDNGFFKILRGEDHCGIESSIVAGEPLYY